MKKALAIFGVAFLIRMILIGAWYQLGQGDRLSSDSQGYYELADNFNHQKGLALEGSPSARRPPIYPLFMAFLLKCGPFPVTIQIAQAVVGAASCVLLWGLGREIFGDKVGLLAAGIMSVDYFSVRQTVVILPEVLFVFFLTGLFYLLVRGTQSNKASLFAGAGFLGGLALLTKEVLLLFIPVILIWMLARKVAWRVRLAGLIGFLAAFCFLVLPWIARNTLIFHRPILVNVSAGHQFYLANNSWAGGGTTGGDWELGQDSFYPEDPLLPPLFTVEADHELFRRAVDFIRNEPGQFLILTGRRILNMWRPYQTDSPWWAQRLAALTYLPVLALGLTGLLWSVKRWGDFFPVPAWILYVFLLHSVLLAHIRYRFPAMPFLMLFSAYALLRIVKDRGAVGHRLHPLLFF